MTAITQLPIYAVEQSTYEIDVTFSTRGGLFAPNAGLTWTLTNAQGAVINGREDVAIDSASVVTVVLSGDDLALFSSQPAQRFLTIKGTYNSDAGTNLPLKGQAQFTVVNLVAVGNA